MLTNEKDKTTPLLKTRHAAALMVFAAAFLVYSVTLANGFVYDDVEVVVNNPWLRDLANIYLAFIRPDWAFTEGSTGSNYYRPLMILFHTLGYHLFGARAWGFHLINVLLHSLNAVLVFFAAGFVMTGNEGAGGAGGGGGGGPDARPKVLFPLAAALVFALHPVNTEPVNWVSSISDLIFVFFALLAFCLYAASPRMAWSYALSVAAFAMAVLAKETAVFLPLMLFLYDRLWRREEGRFRNRWAAYAPFVLAAAAYMAIRGVAIGGVMHREQVELTLFECFINIFPLLSKYAGKLVLPVDLNALYVYEPVSAISEARTILGSLFFVFLATAAYLARQSRTALFGLLWVFVPLLPVLYIPALQTASFADRYLYVSTAGFGFLVALGLSRLVERGGWVKTASLVSFAVLLVLYAAGTVTRSAVWKDDYALWSDTVKKSPGSASAHFNLASTIHKRGEKREAVGHYLRALRLSPTKAKAHFNLALAYQDLGETLKAIEHYERAIDLGHRLEEANYNVAASYIAFGNLERAVFHYREALRLNPGNENAHYNLAWTYDKLGDADRAAAHFRRAIDINPRSVDARYNLGRVYLEKGLLDEAIGEFEAVLRISPGDSDASGSLARALRLKGAK